MDYQPGTGWRWWHAFWPRTAGNWSKQSMLAGLPFNMEVTSCRLSGELLLLTHLLLHHHHHSEVEAVKWCTQPLPLGHNEAGGASAALRSAKLLIGGWKEGWARLGFLLHLVSQRLHRLLCRWERLHHQSSAAAGEKRRTVWFADKTHMYTTKS